MSNAKQASFPGLFLTAASCCNIPVFLSMGRDGDALRKKKEPAIIAGSFRFWWRRGESNPRPRTCEARALPAELRPQTPIGQRA